MDIKEVRHILFNRDGCKCRKCGSTQSLCLDHVLPKPIYQIHTIFNLQTLCCKCNFKKGIHTPSEEDMILIMDYLNDANSIFTSIQAAEMNSILNEYFSNAPPRRKKARKTLRQMSLDKYNQFIQNTA